MPSARAYGAYEAHTHDASRLGVNKEDRWNGSSQVPRHKSIAIDYGTELLLPSESNGNSKTLLMAGNALTFTSEYCRVSWRQ